jgi:hypothetical protein
LADRMRSLHMTHCIVEDNFGFDFTFGNKWILKYSNYRKHGALLYYFSIWPRVNLWIDTQGNCSLHKKSFLCILQS